MSTASGHRTAFSAVQAPEPRAADFGVGKWSRIATYGTKRQRQLDGSFQTFEFTDETFAQGLRNFVAMCASRGGLGSDYEHQTLFSAQNGKEAPNLAIFGALAWVDAAGTVRATESVVGAVPPLDPTAERVRLAGEFPRADSDPAGIWAYCSEVTDLGRSLIPNYRQLSPLFSEHWEDEQGVDQGFGFLNVSFVNVAFQNGTTFAFNQRGLSMDEQMMGKLRACGMPDKPDAEAMKSALAAYMAETEDPPAMRKAMSDACTKFMGDLVIKHDDEDDKEKAMKATVAAMQARLTEEAKERAALEARVKVLDAAENERKAESWKKFSAQFLDEKAAEGFLTAQGGDIDRATRALSALSLPRRSALQQRLTMNGTPVGTDPTPPTVGLVSEVNGLRIIGRDFAAMSRQMVEEGKAKDIASAQALVARKHPHLYI